MVIGNDPILDNLGMAHLGSPKVFLGRKGGVFREIRAFAMRGSMLDMAVGIIVDAAFGRVVSSLVSDILLPPIGLFAGHSDFLNKFINLSRHTYATLAEAKAAGAGTINYGVFFNALSWGIESCFLRRLDRWVVIRHRFNVRSDWEDFSSITIGRRHEPQWWQSDSVMIGNYSYR